MNSAPQIPVVSDAFVTLALKAGVHVASELAQRAGGQDVVIPKRVRADGKLAQHVGYDLAQVLFKVFGAGRLSVPMAHVRGQAARRALAGHLLRKGYSARQVALKADMHERSVWRLKQRLKAG